MDRISAEQRRKNMQAVKCKNTSIERILQKILWQNGFRYRKNVNSVYGKPDIAFLGKKIAIFCDSEFWHGYDWERKKSEIHSNRDFWVKKIENNILRDKKVTETLSKNNWIVLRFWGNVIKKDPEFCLNEVRKAFEKRGNGI